MQIPCQLPGWDASPFLKILTRVLLFQSEGILAVVRITANSTVQKLRLVITIALIISADILSPPGKFPFFSFFDAAIISVDDGRSMLISKENSVVNGISGGSSGGDYSTASRSGWPKLCLCQTSVLSGCPRDFLLVHVE
jgi:hypothetical protein